MKGFRVVVVEQYSYKKSINNTAKVLVERNIHRIVSRGIWAADLSAPCILCLGFTQEGDSDLLTILHYTHLHSRINMTQVKGDRSSVFSNIKKVLRLVNPVEVVLDSRCADSTLIEILKNLRCKPMISKVKIHDAMS